MKVRAKACGFKIDRKPAAFERLWKLFCLTKKLQKNKNPCRIYRAGQFCDISKLLAPPRVEILHEAKFTRNHGAFSRFADSLWSAKWVRVKIMAIRRGRRLRRPEKFAQTNFSPYRREKKTVGDTGSYNRSRMTRGGDNGTSLIEIMVSLQKLRLNILRSNLNRNHESL